jgi:hypothetical protein
MTFQENKLYFNLEREINYQEEPNIFSFPQYSSPISEKTLMDNEEGNEDENESDDENIEKAPLRRSSRISQPSTRLRDFISHKVSYHIENFISYENIIKEYKTCLISIGSQKEPNNFEKAIGQPVWCRVIKEKLNALEKRQNLKTRSITNWKKNRRVQVDIQNKIE